MTKFSFTNEALNIFETIENTSSRIEPYHSEFLASVLANEKSCRFLAELLHLIIGDDQKLISELVKVNPKVYSEFTVDGGSIDIVLHYVKQEVIIAIEVKTTDKSTTVGQLLKYYEGLQNHDDTGNAKKLIVYLTPFNENNVDKALKERIHAIAEFKKFTEKHDCAVHLNWLQVAGLYGFVDGEYEKILLRQHAEYIDEKLCNKESFLSFDRNRGLANFVGGDAFRRFDQYLDEKGVQRNRSEKRWTIPLEVNSDKFNEIVSGLEILADGDDVNKNSNRSSKVPENLLYDYETTGPHADFFMKLFNMLENKTHTYYKGEKDVAVRAVNRDMKKDFSLFSFSRNEIIFIENR